MVERSIYEEVNRSNSIDNLWTLYHSNVMPRNASSVQMKETRRAFYAGIDAFLQMMMHKSKSHKKDSGVKWLSDIKEELREFAAEVREGKV